ncbi:MAG TPA: ABC transporter permease [Acidimicrobiales bacterium]|nr:ABC transporter permease [Acidimicrobiales bacterium]
MTTVSAPHPVAVPSGPVRSSTLLRARWTVADTVTVTKRNLLAYLRIPESLFFSTVQPIMFVLLFTYVFGGAIHVPGQSYVNYLMPGVFVQTVAFGAVSTSIGLAEDLQKGIIERFRALPMSRSAVLTGRTSADMVRNVVTVVIITAVGLLVGFRPSTGFFPYLAAILVILLFAYAISWGFAIIGLSAPNSETAQVMSFPILFPLIFASTAFVPLSSMAGWLQGFATYQPFSVTVNACRALMLGGPTAKWVAQSLAWSLGLLVVLVPLAVRRYRTRI